MRLSLSIFLTAVALAADPIVIAHRGGAALRPENTLVAFRNAIALDVPMLEFDMNVTADGVVVIHHDTSVNPEICKAQGVPAGPIAKLTLAQIRQFDCGDFTRPGSPYFRPWPGERMLTLDEFLTYARTTKAQLLGETKMPQGVSPEIFVAKIHDAITRHGVKDRFILQSSDYATLDAMNRKDKTVSLCVLNARRFKPRVVETAQQHRATHIMLRWDDATPEQLGQLRKLGIRIFSGTANERADWKKYVDLGFDGVLTDDPEGLRNFLRGN